MAGRWDGWSLPLLSVPCVTTPKDMAAPVVFPGMPLPHCVSPGPDPSVLPAGAARPRLPAVPARPGLMQAAFPGKPGHFPTGWGSRPSGEARAWGPCSGAADAGRRQGDTASPWGVPDPPDPLGEQRRGLAALAPVQEVGPGRPCPPRRRLFQRRRPLRVPASPLRSGPRSTPVQRCHSGACPAPAGRAGVLAPRPGTRVALLEPAGVVPYRGDLVRADGA